MPLVTAQGPVPGVGPFNPANYRPLAFFRNGDLPQLVVFNATCQYPTCDIGLIAYQFWFFWPSHPPTFPAQNTTWEPIYIYVNVGTGNDSQIAFRGFHYLWQTIPNSTSITGLSLASGTQRPIVTFQGSYHIPQNTTPSSSTAYTNLDYNYTEVMLSNYPLTDPTDPFQLPNYSYTQLTAYAELAVINVVAISAAWLLLHLRIGRRKLIK